MSVSVICITYAYGFTSSIVSSGSPLYLMRVARYDTRMSGRAYRSPRSGYLAAVVSVILATVVFLLMAPLVPIARWVPYLYLLLIGIMAMGYGVRTALVATLMTAFAWNFFFLPPVHTLTVHDPHDVISLIIFASVGLIMGLLTGHLRERETQAIAREQELSLVNRLSAHLVSSTTTDDMARLLVMEIMQAFHPAEIALLLAATPEELHLTYCLPAHLSLTPAMADRLCWAFTYSEQMRLPLSTLDMESRGQETRELYQPLHTGVTQHGVLYLRARDDHRPYTADDLRLFDSIANLASAYLDRLHLQEAYAQRDALRQADRLKSTLISSVSHELKTPLSAVTATVTSLLEDDVDWDTPTIRHELTAIHQDLSRLHNSISALMDYARLEAAEWRPQRDWYELGEIIGAALTTFPETCQARMVLQLPDALPLIRVDFHQCVRALQHVLENALLYTPADSTIEIGAIALGNDLRCWIRDYGPGIPEEEQAHIFEKFYRGKQSEPRPKGTGLGLAIAAEILRFHDGRIWVENHQPHGACFLLYFPEVLGTTVVEEASDAPI